MRFFMFIPGAMLLADVLWWFAADRRLRNRRRSTWWRAALAVFMSIQVFFVAWMIVTPHSARKSHHVTPTPVLAAVYVWHMLVLPATVAGEALGGAARLLTAIARRIACGLAGKRAEEHRRLHEAASGNTATRRQFVQALAVAAPPVVTAAVVGRSLAKLGEFRIRRFDLPLTSLPPALDGLTIAHVSDIHVGRFTRPRTLPAIVDATNQLRADLVLLTGDLIDLSLSDLPVALDAVRRLDPRHGLFMCEGNHDLIDDPLAFESRVKSSGVPLLLDESRLVYVRGEAVQILGGRWARGDGALADSIHSVHRFVQPGAFSILMAHHPHAFDPAAIAGLPLTLSGHTHGGQLMLTEHLGFGPAMFRYWSGLYRKNGSALIVSNGVGNWFPLRVNAPAEIIHLTLRRAG
jgi:predicted MPP superfamily phosphohydrolase